MNDSREHGFKSSDGRGSKVKVLKNVKNILLQFKILRNHFSFFYIKHHYVFRANLSVFKNINVLL